MSNARKNEGTQAVEQIVDGFGKPVYGGGFAEKIKTYKATRDGENQKYPDSVVPPLPLRIGAAFQRSQNGCNNIF